MSKKENCEIESSKVSVGMCVEWFFINAKKKR